MVALMLCALSDGYTPPARATGAMLRGWGSKGGLLSLRRMAVGVVLAFLAQPLVSFAQECTSEDTNCPAGGCVMPQLPYEEFITAAPSSAGGRDIPSVAER